MLELESILLKTLDSSIKSASGFMQPNTKAAIFYVSTDTCAFLPLEFHRSHGMPLSPPSYESLPEAPRIPVREIEGESPKISVEKIKDISPEAGFLMEARSIRSSNAKKRIEWGQKVEKEIAPKILHKLGFTNIQHGNGRPVDVEAWYNETRYLIDVKYMAQMPSIIRKLSTLVDSPQPAEFSVSKPRRTTTKKQSMSSEASNYSEEEPSQSVMSES